MSRSRIPRRTRGAMVGSYRFHIAPFASAMEAVTDKVGRGCGRMRRHHGLDAVKTKEKSWFESFARQPHQQRPTHPPELRQRPGLAPWAFDTLAAMPRTCSMVTGNSLSEIGYDDRITPVVEQGRRSNSNLISRSTAGQVDLNSETRSLSFLLLADPPAPDRCTVRV